MKSIHAIVLAFFIFLTVGFHARSADAASTCGVQNDSKDQTKFNVTFNKLVLTQASSLHEAVAKLDQLGSSSLCDVDGSSVEHILADPCTAALCGEGADSCMLPCQCNGMSCTVD